MSYQFDPIGTIATPYPEKFAIPRQPGLVTAARGVISLRADCNREEILRGLDGFSHLWLVFVFHEAMREQWKPTVRPPRLGGNQRIGVFASRSPFRPNPIGLSVVELESIEKKGSRWQIHVKGVDLLDQTPILDIKPYIPYADAIQDASGDYADESPATLNQISFSEAALAQLHQQAGRYPQLKELIEQVLSQQPQPAYHRDPERIYGMQLMGFNIRWRRTGDMLSVIEVERL
ncbi:tRNA (N6-threonylcarbamoyladenosine(37)-N6)-methyltransferase TrmO [Pseudomaricurvus alkylphenolicus]|uniref:tRNA (N6-threonylcarbamoyladenosine(37)-N6)-methyltransferase TrmO n=1 Tax=Pseudomaricurvus alkylphenolicus TaxID=1306991 RepID=UPI001421229C|nr:tRNA (N6-threonylcarbamoyladenosine(37)-N6)-methyltransferase TrmO [Pseudomaricurvus alkylphenolicus]NIB43714.1 tRNA (N6-threonylcarbamoyladenosine(37)-N6)-methyltransferase TrmO [Pseudomaricurvus alkylphenolicus]